MEIEFNISRIPDPGISKPVARNSAAASAVGADSLQGASDLERKLTDLPLVRPEKVVQAFGLNSHPKYPPDDILDRIAVLLAIHMSQSAGQ